ncbi:MAG: OadG family transporter subunit [Eubacteriales bacterium]|nr:OadG family transporter subunit [Eubacteriales bacterium]
MRKLRGFLASAVAAAMLAMAVTPVLADETEAQTTEAAAETTEASEAAQAASSEEQAVGEDGLIADDRAALESYAVESINMITSMTDDQIQEILHPSSILSIPQASVVTSVESWNDAKEELGELGDVKEHEITVTDDIISIASTCEFANGEGVVTTILDRDTLTMDSMSFAQENTSLAKTMQEAAMNTVMGIGIVFLVLLFLSFLIGQFKHIAKLEESFKKKSEPAAAPKAAPAPAPVAPAAPVEEAADDGELVAVIAAAIAAAEGTSPDGFVVRSIKRSNRNKWQRA